ncbi:MAG: family 78 glycoside hydrolase catalytic domain [Clostridiales bacterium]|nr:family 78 glycoside hydrolase catalytic domain [Clostridiales bacterium]
MKSSEMFASAKWIAPAQECLGPCFRREFFADDVASAEITICGLGFFELLVNGKKVSRDLLVPAWSQYEDRGADCFANQKTDSMSYRIWCMKYDLGSSLRSGKNALGVRLGSGWYDLRIGGKSQRERCGRIKLCFKLEITHKSGEKEYVLSDENVLWAQGELLESSIYTGERYDFALAHNGFDEPGFDASDWHAPEILEAPESEFFVQTCPADAVVRTITPKLVVESGGKRIYDAGEAITGFAAVSPAEDGACLTVRYAEALSPDGSLDFDSTGWEEKIQQDIFKNTRAGEEYYPHFCWHAFRYIEISEGASLLEVRVVNSDCPVTSSFDSDNEVLNWLYRTYIRTQLDNMHCGVPSDCPHIERLGYTGDGQLCAEAAMLMLDSREFYRKWLEDIADCQDVNTGHVQHTAPFMGGGGGPAGWGGAIVVVPYMFYRCYGEKDVLERFLPGMIKYLDYMLSRSENGLVYHEVDGEWCLGDWCSPAEYHGAQPEVVSRCLIPESYVNTAMLIKFIRMTTEMSEIVGKPELTRRFAAEAEKCARAVKNAYYSPMYKDFCGDVQGANCFAVDAGIAGRDTVESTVKKYKKRGMLDTGIFATDVLPRVLFENGEAQLAFDLLTSDGEISFAYMMKHAATTLWEDWHIERSMNHPMFGAATRYLLTCLLGISQQEGSSGFEKPLIAPKLVNGLDRASGHITTVRGVIAVSFVKSEGFADFEITVPCDALFVLAEQSIQLTEGKNAFRVITEQNRA